jgi:hypothetical protein
MASKTLTQLVRDQILAEAPQISDPDWRERYIDTVLDAMSHAELLERIGSQMHIAVPDARNWL